jgi:hypothetical protein
MRFLQLKVLKAQIIMQNISGILKNGLRMLGKIWLSIKKVIRITKDTEQTDKYKKAGKFFL